MKERLSFDADSLKDITHIGITLWSDTNIGKGIVNKTTEIISSHNLTKRMSLIKTIQSMYLTAQKVPIYHNASSFNNVFFRLNVQERFVLGAFYLNKWNYNKIGEILGKKKEEVECILSKARSQLYLYSNIKINQKVDIKINNNEKRIDCPDYNPENPWVNKFLDKEFSKSVNLFLESHVLKCTNCQNILLKHRTINYDIKKLIPRPLNNYELNNNTNLLLKKLKLISRYNKNKDITFLESLFIFFSRSEIKTIILIFLIFFIILSIVY